MARKLKTIAAVLPVLCLALAAGQAWASCIYNHTKHTIHIDLDCGAFCSNTWYIPKGGDECRPGKGGTVYVNIGQIGHPEFYCADECKVKVDDHGWVSVSQDGDKFVSTSKHKDGSVRERCSSKKYDD